MVVVENAHKYQFWSTCHTFVEPDIQFIKNQSDVNLLYWTHLVFIIFFTYVFLDKKKYSAINIWQVKLVKMLCLKSSFINVIKSRLFLSPSLGFS